MWTRRAGHGAPQTWVWFLLLVVEAMTLRPRGGPLGLGRPLLAAPRRPAATSWRRTGPEHLSFPGAAARVMPVFLLVSLLLRGVAGRLSPRGARLLVETLSDAQGRPRGSAGRVWPRCAPASLTHAQPQVTLQPGWTPPPTLRGLMMGEFCFCRANYLVLRWNVLCFSFPSQPPS